MHTVITGLGHALGKCQVSNDDVSRWLQRHGGQPTSDEWMLSRTGIAFRHWVAGETNVDLAALAAHRALTAAGCTADQLDELIVATCTPNHKTPSVASMLHGRLGCRTDIQSVDLNAACAGFVYSLRHGDLVSRAEGKRVLVVGSEVLTSIANPADRSTLPLFGDGAGAVVLEPRDTADGILGFTAGTDGSRHDLIKVPAGGSALSALSPGVPAAACYLKMDGQQVFRFATPLIVEQVRTLCAQVGISPLDLDLLVPHQANWRIIESAARHLKFPLERVSATIRTCGNTSAASIPISLAMANEQGRLKPGMWVLICAFGAGLVWGSAIIRWV